MNPTLPAPPHPLPVPTPLAHAHELVRRLGEPLLGGNHADVLADAGAARAALVETLIAARDHIHLDAALLDITEPQDGLANRLVALCRQGVRVLVLANHPAQVETLAGLRRAGAAVHLAARPGGLAGWVEHRFQTMHRQLAVVDGRTAWCGPGSSAAQAGEPGPHVRVRGPIVQRLQRLFLQSWKTAEPKGPLPPAQHFPAIPMSGRQRMGIALPASAGGAATAFGCPLIGALDTARFSVFIALARRAPSRRLVQATAAAASRGVNVSVLLQHGAPQAWPWHALCAELMRAGAWLYRGDGTRPLPLHAIVDSVWSSVAIDGGSGWHSGDVMGTTQLIVLDATFASELDTVCQAAMAQALLLDAKNLSRSTPFQRWFGGAAVRPTTGLRPPMADHAITSLPRPAEGPGLNP